jgi:addiction module RelE/StbE family toxin
MRILWTRLARSDVNGIWDRIESDNPTAADLLENRILAAVEILERFPYRGRPGRVAGTRELVIPASPYVVVYFADGIRVVILRVLHGRMNWP